MFEDLSLLTCSYNTPEVLTLCLKSYVFHHGNGPHNIVIVENSVNTETQEVLDLNNIPYIKNPGGTHSMSVDIGLQLIKTKYVLLIDTDVIFRTNINATFYLFKRYDLTLLGEIQEDRGGFLLYPRIAPYFCLTNMDDIRTSKIRFHDEDRITNTNSQGFFKNVPINYEHKDQRFYDVGSVFYEDVQRNNFKIANLEDIENIVYHAESLSWTLQCGIELYESLGKTRQANFYETAMQYKDVDIANCFQGVSH